MNTDQASIRYPRTWEATLNVDLLLILVQVGAGIAGVFRDHDGLPMPEGGVRIENGYPIGIGATVQHLGGYCQIDMPYAGCQSKGQLAWGSTRED